jgi:long-chain acyl-CoA synthetase
MNTIPAYLFENLVGRESEPRFITRGDVTTWAEHAQHVRRIARYISARGFGRGDRIAVYASNSARTIAAILGIQAAGATAVLIHASSTAEQAQWCVRHSEARIVFVDEDRRGRVRADEIVNLLSWSDALLTGRAFDTGEGFSDTLKSVQPDDVAILLYTSGTTGEPKGVPLTHRNFVMNWSEWIAALGVPRGSIDALWLPITHVFGLGEVLVGDMLAFTTHIVEPRDIVPSLAAIRPTLLLGVPSLWEKIVATDADTGGRLSFCLSGGAALKPEIASSFSKHGIVLHEGYGLSETSPTLTVNGRALPSVELKLAPDGEILARGPTVFSGYFRDGEATAVAFENGWFKSGDIGRYVDGALKIVDRKKDILVTAGGKNVAPSAIEARFRDDPFIDHVVIYGEGKRYLVAAIWPNRAAIRAYTEDRYALLQERITRVNSQLPSHETIKRFAIIDSPLTVENGFLTPSLKLKRRKIWDVYRASFEALYGAASESERVVQ